MQVQRVAFENGGAAREFVGVVRARHETDLGFRVSGKIIDARRQCRRPRARRRRHRAARSAGSAAAGRERGGRACRGDLEPGRKPQPTYERYTTLKARGYAAIAEFDRKKAANDEAEGRLGRARRSLDLARNQLAYAELKADADGVITSTRVEPGQVVAIGQAVAQLAHDGEKEAVVALPETWLGEARQAKATRAAVVGRRPQLSGEAARALAAGRSPRPAPMPRASPFSTPTTLSRSA